MLLFYYYLSHLLLKLYPWTVRNILLCDNIIIIINMFISVSYLYCFLTEKSISFHVSHDMRPYPFWAPPDMILWDIVLRWPDDGRFRQIRMERVRGKKRQHWSYLTKVCHGCALTSLISPDEAEWGMLMLFVLGSRWDFPWASACWCVCRQGIRK